MSDFHIRLPATSANLGPGFDAVAVALTLYLVIHADVAETYSISATGRNADLCARLHRNLMLSVYEDTLRAAGKSIQHLTINVNNDIPIGMGCGSSAAARLAGLALANHFGKLAWSSDRILLEACKLEGHPDNAAACWLGGYTVAASSDSRVLTSSVEPPDCWQAIVVLPDQPLATAAARSILPARYLCADAIANIQNVALLTAAFHQGNSFLLQKAMGDRLHQPYRLEVCPLLPLLLPLADEDCILGIALSGAGPSILAIVLAENVLKVKDLILKSIASAQTVEIVHTTFSGLTPRRAGQWSNEP